MTTDRADGGRTAVVIGDSFVDGAGAADRHGWAYRLGDALEGYDVRVRGHGGDTIEDVLRRTDADVLELDPDLVVLQVGINDSRLRESFPTDHDVPPGRYASGVREFVSRVRASRDPPARIAVVGTVPVDEALVRPYKPDKEYTTAAAREYNALARDVCRDADATFVDVFRSFEARDPPGSLLDDGLHPNDEGHELICEIVADAVQAVSMPESEVPPSRSGSDEPGGG